MATPILHDVIQSILTYNYHEVQEIIRKTYPRWKLFSNWEVVEARKEYPLYRVCGGACGYTLERKYLADVVWLMSCVRSEGVGKYVVHEIKTGDFDLDLEIKFYAETRVSFSQRKDILKDHVTGFATLCIWARRDVIRDQLEKLSDFGKVKVRYGYVRLLEIELLYPVIEAVFSELQKEISRLRKS